MGGFFGAVSKDDCVFDLFFGVDYHSHLGTRRAGMAVYDFENGFDKAIHNIENAPFRTKFTKESNEMHGQMGIGCISDFEAQPILVRSHHGTFAIATVALVLPLICTAISTVDSTVFASSYSGHVCSYTYPP